MWHRRRMWQVARVVGNVVERDGLTQGGVGVEGSDQVWRKQQGHKKDYK